MVGYSRLAGADEDRTLARLRTLRSDLIDPTISVHRGRIVKRTVDGSLVEFHSVVDTVRCTMEVQNGMVERNAGLPDHLPDTSNMQGVAERLHRRFRERLAPGRVAWMVPAMSSSRAPISMASEKTAESSDTPCPTAWMPSTR